MQEDKEEGGRRTKVKYISRECFYPDFGTKISPLYPLPPEAKDKQQKLFLPSLLPLSRLLLFF